VDESIMEAHRCVAQRPTVLLVTYNADEQQLYGGALEEAGFSVAALCDPDVALRTASAQRPAAVVTRIFQPGHSMNGLDLTRAIKSHRATATTPVIILTSFSQSENREATFAAELVAAVSRAVNQAHAGEV
jgi:CheY-like chemotaxis protein